jgi:trimeric autotransporter adhesin
MRLISRGAVVSVGCTVALFAVVATAAGAAPTVVTVAGTGAVGHTGDGGPAARALLASPSGIAVDGAGDVVVADSGNCRIQVIAGRSGRHFGIAMKARHIYTVAGTSCQGHVSSSPRVPSMSDPTGVAVDAAGDLLIADGPGNRILELPATSGRDYGVAVTAGRLTSVAGTGVAGAAAGGPARSSRLDDPQGIAVDAAGDIYIADTAACQVDEVPARDGTRLNVRVDAGHLYPVAGTGTCGYSGDGGNAALAQLWSPSAVTVDGVGDVLIADEGNSAVREIPATTGTFYGVAIAAGDIATVAGQDTFSTYINDGFPATGPVADVNYPSGVAVDAAGDLFIADSYDRSIVEVPAHNGVLFGRNEVADDMYTLAGILPVGGAALGDGTRWILTRVTYPDGVAVGPGEVLYFTDQGGNTVRRIAGS